MRSVRIRDGVEPGIAYRAEDAELPDSQALEMGRRDDLAAFGTRERPYRFFAAFFFAPLLLSSPFESPLSLVVWIARASRRTTRRTLPPGTSARVSATSLRAG